MPPLPDYIANWQPREFGALPMDAEARLDGDEPRPRIRTTAFFGGHTGTRRARCVEFPTDTELSEMSWGEVEALHFPRIDWLARGGLDALRFYRSDGVVSDFYGASPANERRELRWGEAGDLRFAMDTAKLGDADVRAIDVWWYRHDVAGLAFVDRRGKTLAKQRGFYNLGGRGGGHQRVTLGPHEKLVGFKLWTDHCTPRIAFKIADLTPHGRGTPLVLTVSQLSGRRVEIEAASTDSVAHLKTLIAANEGIPAHHQRLAHDGAPLEKDHASLQSCGIASGANLHLVFDATLSPVNDEEIMNRVLEPPPFDPSSYEENYGIVACPAYSYEENYGIGAYNHPVGLCCLRMDRERVHDSCCDEHFCFVCSFVPIVLPVYVGTLCYQPCGIMCADAFPWLGDCPCTEHRVTNLYVDSAPCCLTRGPARLRRDQERARRLLAEQNAVRRPPAMNKVLIEPERAEAEQAGCSAAAGKF